MISTIVTEGIQCPILQAKGQSNDRFQEGNSVYAAAVMAAYWANRDGLGVIFGNNIEAMNTAQVKEKLGFEIAEPFRNMGFFEWVPPDRILALAVTINYRSRRIPIIVWPPAGSSDNRWLSKKLGLPVLTEQIAARAHVIGANAAERLVQSRSSCGGIGGAVRNFFSSLAGWK